MNCPLWSQDTCFSSLLLGSQICKCTLTTAKTCAYVPLWMPGMCFSGSQNAWCLSPFFSFTPPLQNFYARHWFMYFPDCLTCLEAPVKILYCSWHGLERLQMLLHCSQNWALIKSIEFKMLYFCPRQFTGQTRKLSTNKKEIRLIISSGWNCCWSKEDLSACECFRGNTHRLLRIVRSIR